MIIPNATVGLLRYDGGDNGIYTFKEVIQWEDNFLDLRPQTETMAGLPGGFDALGYDAAPSKVGRVDAQIMLTAQNPAEMTALKDDISRIGGWGKQRLYRQPDDLTLAVRWCNARVVDLKWSEKAGECTDYNQVVNLLFEVPDARWYVTVGNAPLWNGTTWNGSTWGGGADTAYSGASALNLSITSKGTAPSPPLIIMQCGAAQTITNPVIERIVNGAAVERVKLNGTIGNNQIWVVDCRSLATKLNGQDVYDDLERKRSNWLSIAPGANTIRFTSSSTGDAGTVRVQYDEAYFK